VRWGVQPFRTYPNSLPRVWRTVKARLFLLAKSPHMSVLKNKLKAKFSQLPNELITDDRLSHGAFRVAAYLFSRPDGWNILNSDIQKQLGIKQAQTLADYWQELLYCGWITRERKRENGKIVGGFDYELSLFRENPQCEKPLFRENVTIGETNMLNNTDEFSNTESFSNTDKRNSAVGEPSDFVEYERQVFEKSVTDILEAVNLYGGRNLPTTGMRSEGSRKKVKALFKRKYTAAEILDVIQCKCFEWKNDSKMAQYIHPTTLFLPSNFQKYLDLVNDLKADPIKSELFKKKINGTPNGRNKITDDFKRQINDMLD